MTRKDYVALAAAFKTALDTAGERDATDDTTARTWGVAIARNEVCKALKLDNPRFDIDRFIRATNGGLS